MKKKRRIVTWVLAMAMLFAVWLPSRSATADVKEKSYRLNDQGWDAYKFTVEFSDSQSYTGYIEDIYGTQYVLMNGSGNSLTCTVKQPVFGEWLVHIDGPEGVAPSYSVKISKVSSGETYNPNQSIVVGKDISDLRTYFVDDSVVVDWSSSDAGNVIVKVVDISTKTVIGSNTVTGTRYECRIPEGVKTIRVTAVPEASANISGIEKSFNLDIPTYPATKVTFFDAKYANKESTKVHISLDGTYGCYATVNGKEVYRVDTAEGEFDIDVPLAEDGTNVVKVYVVDEHNNQFSTTANLIKDTVEPEMAFNAEYDGITTGQQIYKISGRVRDYDTVYVNDSQVIPATDGYYEFDCSLHSGDNIIEVVANDEAGNQFKRTLHIKYSASAGGGSSSIYTILSLIILTVVGIVLYKILSKAMSSGSGKKDGEEEKPKESGKSLLDKFIESVRGKKEETEEDSADEAGPEPEPVRQEAVTDAPAEPKEKGKSLLDKVIDKIKQSRENKASEKETVRNEDTGVSAEAPAPNAPVRNTEPEPKKNAPASDDYSGYDYMAADDAPPDEAPAPEPVAKPAAPEPAKAVETPEEKVIEKPARVSDEHVRTVAEPVRTVSSETVIPASQFAYDEDDEDEDDEDERPKKKDRKADKKRAKERESAEGYDLTTGHKAKKRKKINTKPIKRLFVDIILIIIIYVTFTYVFEVGYVSSGSMEPYMMTGDLYYASRTLLVDVDTVSRGDVIAFKRSDNKEYVKRVIGVEGDTVSFNYGEVYVNGSKIDESAYLTEDVMTYCGETFTVPDGCFFVMGDNRTNSLDSRKWDNPYVSGDEIISKVHGICSIHNLSSMFKDLFGSVKDKLNSN